MSFKGGQKFAPSQCAMSVGMGPVYSIGEVRLDGPHGVDAGWKRSGVTSVPLQVSGASHSFAAVRPAAPAGWANAGQSVDPTQRSGRSQGSSDDARQTVPYGRTLSGGQIVVTPSQRSTMSQGPSALRQTVIGGCTSSAGQAAALPVQTSATSQALMALRQGVPEASN